MTGSKPRSTRSPNSASRVTSPNNSTKRAGTFTLRPARPADAPGIARVHVETWRRAYAGIVSADFLAGLSIERRRQRWRQSLESPEPGTGLFVCTQRRSIIAFCSCGAVREDATPRRGEVYAIYVLPAAQGCGAGRALMRAAAAHLLAQGMTSMLLWVLKDNLPARQFYGSLGGTALEEKPITIGDQSLIEVAYAWDDLNTLAKE